MAAGATYIVGDVQGCYASLQALLAEVGFGSSDNLWCVGDLVNRGPDSLAVLRFARNLGERFRCVLGNHDLHFLAMVYGDHPHRAGDTLTELLAAPDCAELADWLRRQPLLEEGDDWLMAHAGIPPLWTIEIARAAAEEVAAVLRGPDHRQFFERMYGNEPAGWDEALVGMARHRVIVNYFTRMRLLDAGGGMEFGHRGALVDLPAGYQPWFRYPSRIAKTIYFGHWAALNGATGNARAVALDTGCVWGRRLTAIRLHDRRLFSVSAVDARPIEREPGCRAHSRKSEGERRGEENA